MVALLFGYAPGFLPTSKTSPPNATPSSISALPQHGSMLITLAGTNRERPGLREAMAACREDDTLVVCLPDARAILAELTARQVKLNLGGSVHDPTDAVGRLLFNVLAMVAEFEADLIRLCTRVGVKVAKVTARLRGKQPMLNPRQEAHVVGLYRTGENSTGELADLFSVGRSTVYRALERDERQVRS
jgi:DNA invertase Pin-like site-specific DNA recombinase